MTTTTPLSSAGWAPAGIALGLLLALAGTAPALQGQARIDERRPLDADGRLEVVLWDHSVRISGWDREELHLTGTLAGDRDRLRLDGDRGAFAIRLAPDGMSVPGGSGTLEIRVPEGVRLSVTTRGGDVAVEGVSGTVRAVSVSGRLGLEGAPASCALTTVSGAVEVRGPAADLRVTTVSGAVVLRGVEGRVEVNATSGRTEVEAGRPVERLRVSSVSGGVEFAGSLTARASVEVATHSGAAILRIPADTPAEYEVDTFSGGIENRLTGDASETPGWGPGRGLSFSVGEGTARVHVSTFSGRVVLEPLP